MGIVQIVLEIIFTGGSVSIERLFAKSAAIIKGFVKKAGSFADDVFRSLDKLISLIKKGADNFASFIRKIFDDFFEWLKNIFKSGKADEVLDGINQIGSGGILKYFKIISRNMVSQEHSMSCAAACIRQLEKDYGIDLEEALIRELARTTKETGTFPDGILDALKKVFKDKEIEAGMFYNPKISDIEMAKSISKEGSWISIIRPSGHNSHAIIVDKIENGKVFIRDPWPIEGIGKGNGVEAIISEDEFALIWAQGGNYMFKVK